MKVREKARMLIGAVRFVLEFTKAGIDFWIDPPRTLKLEVDKDRESRLLENLEKCKEVFGRIPQLGTSPLLPPKKRIYLKRWYQYTGLDYAGQIRTTDHFSQEVIAINLNTRRIDYGESTPWLFGQYRPSEGEMGLVLFTFPVTILLSPFIYLISAYYRHLENIQGMSRHSYALLQSLKGQLDKETESQLEAAMRNSWQHNKEMSRIVTFEEAKVLLSKCRMERVTGVRKYADGTAPRPRRQSQWYNEAGEMVANGGPDPAVEHSVRVLGSRFWKKEATELEGCFASAEIRGHSEDDED